AGGSIGREICRQIIKYEPDLLILLGRGENSIYELEVELRSKVNFPLKIFIGDIRDLTRMKALFREFKPEVVFHAAAHKHVYLMEENTSEAITNNVFGTLNLVKLAKEYQVENFVFLSTDKAVNPISVMGASKRLAEMILQNEAKNSQTKFISVRFGNVLDSRGSVIPTFRSQISKGGPVTLTHPEMTRFFMTIPEAVQLVIQTGGIGKGGEIFVLDMGKPIKILDLAKNMIKLSGFEEKDISINIIGIRQGEKIKEELLNLGEEWGKTEVEKILKLKDKQEDFSYLELNLEELKLLVNTEDKKTLISKLKKLVPNYKTNF
ncbi:MAG: polysaccharide biosynthesis protein, partial [Armatimonadetes bacterium]|nr:polysaccharide biosynthesis protein [Armatimonadota bacterium]